MVPAFEGLRFLSLGENARSVRALCADLKRFVLRTEEVGAGGQDCVQEGSGNLHGMEGRGCCLLLCRDR